MEALYELKKEWVALITACGVCVETKLLCPRDGEAWVCREVISKSVDLPSLIGRTAEGERGSEAVIEEPIIAWNICRALIADVEAALKLESHRVKLTMTSIAGALGL